YARITDPPYTASRTARRPTPAAWPVTLFASGSRRRTRLTRRGLDPWTGPWRAAPRRIVWRLSRSDWPGATCLGWDTATAEREGRRTRVARMDGDAAGSHGGFQDGAASDSWFGCEDGARERLGGAVGVDGRCGDVEAV